MKRGQLIVLSILLMCNICIGILAFSTFTISDAYAEVVREGMRGARVREIQTKLKEYGFFNDKIDGIYGARTKAAVKRFQSAKGITADGIVGNATLKKLGIAVSSGGYSESDIYLLAKCIHAEARGEPYIGQVAVGAVVLNRVRSSAFPNSIAGVIYQPWAFTAVNDGQINLEPNESARKAAKDAMSGWDPTNGCIYYYNPRTATSKWIWSREVRLVIGRHRFAV